MGGPADCHSRSIYKIIMLVQCFEERVKALALTNLDNLNSHADFGSVTSSSKLKPVTASNFIFFENALSIYMHY